MNTLHAASRLPRSGNTALAAAALIQAALGIEFVFAGLSKIVDANFAEQFKTFVENSPGSKSTSNGMILPSGDTFANDQAIFEEEDGVDGSLGPVYNARGCVDCHQTPVTGGSSQVTELRVGHRYGRLRKGACGL